MRSAAAPLCLALSLMLAAGAAGAGVSVQPRGVAPGYDKRSR
ncbi:hypothetical protein ACLB1G_16975 [Oxalobacteraceae bacterium A2-2]